MNLAILSILTHQHWTTRFLCGQFSDDRRFNQTRWMAVSGAAVWHVYRADCNNIVLETISICLTKSLYVFPDITKVDVFGLTVGFIFCEPGAFNKNS